MHNFLDAFIFKSLQSMQLFVLLINVAVDTNNSGQKNNIVP